MNRLSKKVLLLFIGISTLMCYSCKEESDDINKGRYVYMSRSVNMRIIFPASERTDLNDTIIYKDSISGAQMSFKNNELLSWYEGFKDNDTITFRNWYTDADTVAYKDEKMNMHLEIAKPFNMGVVEISDKESSIGFDCSAVLYLSPKGNSNKVDTIPLKYVRSEGKIDKYKLHYSENMEEAGVLNVPYITVRYKGNRISW